LGRVLDFFPEEDKDQIFAHASKESLAKLAETHMDKEIWKKLKQAERQKIKYYRRKKKVAKRLAKLQINTK